MSRRTAESNKAIVLAWEREQKRVSEGKGTRDWTPEQQKDILERGKAYDDNGKAFEGQHMRSAEMHPECQGNPDNIQFLTRQEHFEAHDGDWKNPTNWQYDPVTKSKLDFGDGPIIPCKEINLSNPICQCNGNKQFNDNNKKIENQQLLSSDQRINMNTQHTGGGQGQNQNSQQMQPCEDKNSLRQQKQKNGDKDFNSNRGQNSSDSSTISQGSDHKDSSGISTTAVNTRNSESQSDKGASSGMPTSNVNSGSKDDGRRSSGSEMSTTASRQSESEHSDSTNKSNGSGYSM